MTGSYAPGVLFRQVHHAQGQLGWGREERSSAGEARPLPLLIGGPPPGPRSRPFTGAARLSEVHANPARAPHRGASSTRPSLPTVHAHRTSASVRAQAPRPQLAWPHRRPPSAPGSCQPPEQPSHSLSRQRSTWRAAPARAAWPSTRGGQVSWRGRAIQTRRPPYSNDYHRTQTMRGHKKQRGLVVNGTAEVRERHKWCKTRRYRHMSDTSTYIMIVHAFPH